MKKILLFTLVVCLSLTIGALTPVTAENIKQGGTMVVTYKDDVSTPVSYTHLTLPTTPYV